MISCEPASDSDRASKHSRSCPGPSPRPYCVLARARNHTVDDPCAPPNSIAMSALSNAFARNRILAGLPSEERRMIEPRSDVTRVYLGDVMDRAGEAVAYLCFPVDAAISMMDMKDRTHTLDVALVGAEGCTGAWVAQGSET